MDNLSTLLYSLYVSCDIHVTTFPWQEEHYTTLLYQLPTSEALLLHTVFETMEEAKETLGILVSGAS